MNTISNPPLLYKNIAVILSDSVKDKCINIFGNSKYFYDGDEKYIVLSVKSSNWFSFNLLQSDPAALLTEIQFDYILDLYQLGIPLNSTSIQDYLKHCMEINNG